MPRQKPRRTDLDTRLRNMTEILGRPGLAGLSRVGGQYLGDGGAGQSVLVNSASSVDAASMSAQLLVMSATADSIASGGDYVAFDAVVARHGFTEVPSDAGDGWMHPVSGVYLLVYEHDWDTYQGGGTVALELDGTLVPEGTIMDGTSGQEGRASIVYAADADQVGKVKVTQSSGSAQTCDAVVRIAISDPTNVSAAAIASNVVSLGTQSDPDIASYTAGGAAWNDPDAEWIWHIAPVGGERPENEEGWFTGAFRSPTAVAVTVEYSCDNECAIYLNGTSLGTQTGLTSHWENRYTASATLEAGANKVEVYGKNLTGGTGNNAAAVILSIHNSTGTVLFRTNDETGWTGYTAEPADWLS